MTEQLHTRTSTLIVKLPSNIEIPAFNDKPRTRKAILRTIVQTLQTRTLELIYVGPQPDAIEMIAASQEGVLVTVNVINDPTYDFNATQQALLKRFKRELQNNNEHILIDSETFNNGNYQRRIEIYIKSHLGERIPSKQYHFAAGSGAYNFLRAAS